MARIPWRRLILLLGGGDLASGAALRLHRAGLQVLVTELPRPLAVRRWVSFSEAVYRGRWTVEGVSARLVPTLEEARLALEQGEVPVLVDPHLDCIEALRPAVLIDGRMAKRAPEWERDAAPLTIGLGPGFNAGENCHVVVETNRGHALGRTIWSGPAEDDTGVPEQVAAYGADRVLRAPADGELVVRAEIGEHLNSGQVVAEVAGQSVRSPFSGVLRGLLPGGLPVECGMKIGDVDPRDNPEYCRMVSDKALAVGGGVLEAVLTRPDLRALLYCAGEIRGG